MPVRYFRFMNSNFLSRSRSIAVLILVLHTTLTSITWGQSPAFAIDTDLFGSSVDAHPYSIVIDEANLRGYATICGDVAPFGEPVASYSNNKVIEFDIMTLQMVRNFTVGYFPTEMVLTDGKLWVTCSSGNQLYRIDLADGSQATIDLVDSTGSPITYPSGLAVGPGGQIFVASNGGNFDGSSENVVSIDTSSLQISQRYTVSGAISKLAFLDDGSLLVPVGFPGDDFTASPVLLWIDPDSGDVLSQLALDVDTTDFPDPSDLHIVGDGTALLTIFGGDSVVYRIDLADRSLLSAYPVPGSDTVHTAVVTDTESSFLVAEFFSHQLSRIDLVTGETLAILEGLNQPNDIQVSAGRIFTTDQGANTISIHVSVGAFLRADINMDGDVDVADAIGALQYLFLGVAIPCLDSADIDDNGVLDISDPVLLLLFLFSAGVEPSQPFPVAGADPGKDSLDCLETS